MFSSAKVILIIGNDALAIYRNKGKKISRIEYLGWDDPSFDNSFLRAMKQGKAGEKVIILFDMIEQQYKKEVIPKINFIDRNKVVRRRSEMAFPNNSIHAYMELKKKPKTGEGKLYLFASVSESKELERVIDLLAETQAQIKGLYLLPLEASQMANVLDRVLLKSGRNTVSEWVVLITYNRTGGLRQVVIRDGELALTRLTPLGSSRLQNPDLAQDIVKEFNATLTYLARFGYQAKDGLDLIAVCSPEDAARLQQANLPVNDLAMPTPAEAVRYLDMQLALLPGEEDNNSSGILHAAWAARAKKMIMPLSMTALHKIKSARMAAAMILMLLTIIGMGLILYSGFLFQQNMQYKSELAAKQSIQNSLRQTHREESKMFEVLKYEPDMVESFLDIHDSLLEAQFDASHTLNAVNKSLGSIRLDGLTISVKEKKPDNPYQKISAIPTKGDGPPEISITLTVQFPENQPPEVSATQTDAFVIRLKSSFPGKDVKIVEKAGDLTAEGAMSGVSSMDVEKTKKESVSTKSIIRIEGQAL